MSHEAREESTPTLCAACGEPIVPGEKTWTTRTDGPVHHACEIREDRRLMWRDIRRLMRTDLAFPCAQAIGRTFVEPIIEPIGAETRKPSQVFTALMTLRHLVRNVSSSAQSKEIANLAIERNLALLRQFLGRK